jgi:hypothetical protein
MSNHMARTWDHRRSKPFGSKLLPLPTGLLPLLVLEEMELEWSGDKGNEVVRDRRIVPIIFHLAYRWIKKASEPQRLCFSFFLWSSFLLTRSTHTLCTKSGIRWSRSVSLSRTRKAEVSFGKISGWELTVGIMLGEVDWWISIAKEMLHMWELLKRWRFEEEETTNLQLVQSSLDLLLIFKLHSFTIFFKISLFDWVNLCDESTYRLRFNN